MKKLFWLAVSTLLLIALTACDSGPSSKQGGGDKQPQYLSIKGSDTMVHLVSTWAEEFMKTAPDADISVTGGGSGTGIAAMLNKTTDICAASRAINDKEKKLAEQGKIEAKEIAVARDAIAVVVNPDNPIGSLTMDQLRQIFTGKAANWKDVGGPDAPILVLSRESSSGTFVFFQEHVLNKEDYTQSARLLPGTSAIVQAVASDRWAIAYVGLGFATESKDKVKALGVQAPNQNSPVLPSEESVRSGEYGISRPLFFYTNGAPQGMAQRFIDFCMSPAGQKIVKDTGYVPVS